MYKSVLGVSLGKKWDNLDIKLAIPTDDWGICND